MQLQRILLAITLFLLPLSHAQAEVRTGAAAPDFTATDITGEKFTLSSYKGTPVVLEWTNPECPFVKKHYGSGNMQKTQAYAKDKGAVWISINSSADGKQGYMTDTDAKAKLAEQKAEPTRYVRDETGAIGHLYGAKTTPHLFVIDKNGMIAYQGAIDSKATADPADIAGATNYVMAAVDALKNGTKLEKDTTQPYGCSVKY